jgi:hypothetical protein
MSNLGAFEAEVLCDRRPLVDATKPSARAVPNSHKHQVG